jgi:CheY-like chemotaxis protein
MAGPILVLEDDTQVLDTVTDVLRSAGYGVIGLRHPELVLEVVAHEPPDLILVDMMLPAQSGIDVADRLWVNGFGAAPMIAMSASGIMLDLARQMPFFDALIRKPFDIDTLLSTVDRALADHDVLYQGRGNGMEQGQNAQGGDATSICHPRMCARLTID